MQHFAAELNSPMWGNVARVRRLHSAGAILLTGENYSCRD